jgi:hypothetical protein
MDDGRAIKPLAPHRHRFKSRQGLWIHSCEEAIKLAYGTFIDLFMCLHLLKKWSYFTSKAGKRRMTYTVLVRRETQTKQKIRIESFSFKHFRMLLLKYFQQITWLI